MTKDEALKLALEALEMWCPMTATYLNTRDEAITAIREAQAERPAHQQEPVAWLHNIIEDLSITHRPVDIDKWPERWTPLYTSPPQRKPLTDREVELLDGMIEVQLDHARRCDSIGNRPMADKQKAWDMERVELLRKLKSPQQPPQQQEPVGEVGWAANVQNSIKEVHWAEVPRPPVGTKLYTSPPHRKPLDEREREWIVATCPTPRHIIKAVEAAHGIKE